MCYFCVFSGALADIGGMVGVIVNALEIMDRDASCCGKVRHETPGGAGSHAARLNRRKGNALTFEAYPCRYCAGWHVGGVDSKAEAE